MASAADQATNVTDGPSNSTPKKTKETKVTPIGNFPSIEEFAKGGFGEIVEATKRVNSFPQGAARDLYCAYPTFGRIVDQQSDRILGLISKVLKWQNIKGNIQRRQQDEQFEMLLECNDAMLERLQMNLDDMAGIKKNQQTIVVETHLNTVTSNRPQPGSGAGSWNLKKTGPSPMAARLITAKNIARPQLKFRIPVDNSATSPFVPQIKDKPNSLKPLAILPEYDDTGNIASYLHPYEFELMKFEPSKEQLKRKSPQMPPETSASELMYVDCVPKLKAALEELRECKEIAIDVEHHSYRTFLGFTCLVQISTRSKDYIFDALALRTELHILNEVFTDPKVVKIFHGADLDVEWLQRDLSLYIANMFDTHQAAKALSLARLSLSYLLQHYCDIEADKTFQLADWRIRPLPAELVSYARQDTHYLIYIYECITNDLLDAAHQKTNLLNTIYQRSTEICKKRYAKPMLTLDSHMDLFRKSKRIFDNRQLFALREIFQWRDAVARQEDESYGYVLPNHMMLQISESLPREMQGILACCNPIPPLVRQSLHALHQIILRARDQPLVKPVLETEVIHRAAVSNIKDYNSKLYCPHDLSHTEEFRDDLPTLVHFQNEDMATKTQQQIAVFDMAKPQLTIFDTPDQSEEDDDEVKKRKLLEHIGFISPFQRYLTILPLAEKEKREEAARIEAENKKRQLCPEAAQLLPVKKTENGDVAVKTESANDDAYSLPIKEMLKRKYEESVANRAAEAKRFKNETPNDDKLKFANLPTPPPSRQKQNKATVSTQGQGLPRQPHNAATTTPPSRNKTALNTNNNPGQVIEVDDSSDEDAPPDEMPSTSQAQVQQPQNRQQQNSRNKNRKNKFKGNKSFQSSDKPAVHTHFDYKNVDFKKFQGGAQRAKGTELKPQFHGKSNSNKANNKKFNKLFTFSNVKGNKK